MLQENIKKNRDKNKQTQHIYICNIFGCIFYFVISAIYFHVIVGIWPDRNKMVIYPGVYGLCTPGYMTLGQCPVTTGVYGPCIEIIVSWTMLAPLWHHNADCCVNLVHDIIISMHGPKFVTPTYSYTKHSLNCNILPV